MSFVKPAELKYIVGVSEQQLQLINAFVQGAVYSWVKNRGEEWFATQDVLGQVDLRKGTPLRVFFENHTYLGKTPKAAAKAAIRDLEWLLRSVLARDPLLFESNEMRDSHFYRWAAHSSKSPVRNKRKLALA